MLLEWLFGGVIIILQTLPHHEKNYAKIKTLCILKDELNVFYCCHGTRKKQTPACMCHLQASEIARIRLVLPVKSLKNFGCSLSSQHCWLVSKTNNTEDRAVPKDTNDFKSFLVSCSEKKQHLHRGISSSWLWENLLLCQSVCSHERNAFTIC